jgi:hypothetical protein
MLYCQEEPGMSVPGGVVEEAEKVKKVVVVWDSSSTALTF